MRLPEGWTAGFEGEHSVVARSADRKSVIVIAPLTGSSTANEDLRGRALEVIRGYLPGAEIRQVYPSSERPRVALASFGYAGGRGAVMTAKTPGGGTVYFIAGPDAVFAAERSQWVEALRSFRFTSPAGPAAKMEFVRFDDPEEGAFTAMVPAGWETRGGTVRHGFTGTGMVHYVRMTSPDGRIVAGYNDPAERFFAVPNETLVRLGLAGGGSIVKAYRPGAESAKDFLEELRVSLRLEDISVKAVTAPPERKEKTGGAMQSDMGGIEFTARRNGLACSGFAGAITVLSSGKEVSSWVVHSLVYGIGPEGQEAVVHSAVEKLTGSWKFSPGWAGKERSGQQADGGDTFTAPWEEMDELVAATYWQTQIDWNRSGKLIGGIRLRDPATGARIAGMPGSNCYWRVSGTGRVARPRFRAPSALIDVRELLEVRE